MATVCRLVPKHRAQPSLPPPLRSGGPQRRQPLASCFGSTTEKSRATREGNLESNALWRLWWWWLWLLCRKHTVQKGETMTMTLITRSISSLCTQTSDLPWRLAGIMQEGRSRFKHFGWAKKKTLSCTSLGSQRSADPSRHPLRPSTAPARISVVRKKSQLWRAEHLHSDPDAPKTHCAKSVLRATPSRRRWKTLHDWHAVGAHNVPRNTPRTKH